MSDLISHGELPVLVGSCVLAIRRAAQAGASAAMEPVLLNPVHLPEPKGPCNERLVPDA
jgi:hypothetical protein